MCTQATHRDTVTNIRTYLLPLSLPHLVQDSPPQTRGSSPVVSALSWSRQLYHKINEPMKKFTQHKTLMQTNVSSRLYIIYLCICTYMQLCSLYNTNESIGWLVSLCVCVCVRACVRACACVCVCVCVRTYICVLRLCDVMHYVYYCSMVFCTGTCVRMFLHTYPVKPSSFCCMSIAYDLSSSV